MSEATNETSDSVPNPNVVLCRVVDVNMALQNAFQSFLKAEGKTLDDLATLLRDELAKLELFVPSNTSETNK